MPGDRDHYEIYYADKLWNLLPAVYRTADTDTFGTNGPLREMVNRIGAQAAFVRRSIDRLWEDQSIETCDDWVIPYIADLLATNLVASMDARGQRLDVAKTIYYRRRKGTVAILEEIAHDITGWDARVIEFFRRLGRTRHCFDPAIGLPADTDDPIGNAALQIAEGLVGSLTHTDIGGWADLRNAYGAFQAQGPFPVNGTPALPLLDQFKPASAFDEFFHTADFRNGRARVGWYNIPNLGVFLWRLHSFGVDFTTPVPVQNCAGHYAFDPTGRKIPLFAASVRSYGDTWVSPQEWQLPTPISRPLLEAGLKDPTDIPLYAAVDPADGVTLLFHALGVFRRPGSFFDLVSPTQLKIYPDLGRFQVLNPPPNDQVFVTYHYGFSSTIGAGAYDRRILREAPNPEPTPVQHQTGGGLTLAAPLASLAPVGTLSIDDSLTYTATGDVVGIDNVTVMTRNSARPVVRLDPPLPNPTEWIFTGSENSSLVIEGLLISGGDVVLSGKFDSVTLTCCTLDPGTAGTSSTFDQSVDGRDLIPCHLWVEAEVRQLTINRCILGPIQTRANGEIQTLTMSDSIAQALGTDPAIHLITGQVQLSRCTILGPASVDRLYASECILDDVVQVIDTQGGCVRFTAWSSGSVLPRQYESVEIAPQSPLFTSRRFGQPGYAQLLQSVDTAVLHAAPGATISAGATDGSQMGAFAREKNPIKERSLLIKYQEFMPLSLNPVIIYVT